MDNFVSGIRSSVDYEVSYRCFEDKFHPAWADVQDPAASDLVTGYIADRMMEDEGDDPTPSPSVKSKMPDCIESSFVISAGGTINIMSMSMAFANLELYDVTISAIVTSSIRIGDFRSWPKEVSIWTPASPEEAESRGVFGRIWTAEVYARNSIYYQGCSDSIYLLACPNKAYPRGLWTKIQVETYNS